MIAVSEAYKESVKTMFQVTQLYGTIDGQAFTEANILSGSFSVQWQFSDNTRLQIGTAYVSELTATFYDVSGITPTTLYDKTIIPFFGSKKADGLDFENIQIGVFIIKEVEVTDDGIRVRAYDNMVKFDKEYNPLAIGIHIDEDPYRYDGPVDPSSGRYVYSLLRDICTVCGVPFGMQSNQINEFANWDADLFQNLFAIDVRTYRDLIAQIAELTGTFATVNNEGSLILRALNETVVDSVGADERYFGTVFSGYKTTFSAVALDIEEGSVMYPSNVTNGLIYELDNSNSLFYYAGNPSRTPLPDLEKIVNEIYTKSLSKINHTPFTVTVPPNTAYELGDIIRFEGGRAGTLDAEGVLGMVSGITFSYPHGTTLRGVGENPHLSKAKSRELLKMEKASIYEPHIAQYFGEHIQVYQESDFDDTATYDENTIIAVVEDYT